MRIVYKLPKRLPADARKSKSEPTPDPTRPSRMARMIALAHKLERMVQSGEVRDYAELARLGQITPARLSQILILAQLAPAIQERLLFASAQEFVGVSEHGLREIAGEVRWDRQQRLLANAFRASDEKI